MLAQSFPEGRRIKQIASLIGQTGLTVFTGIAATLDQVATQPPSLGGSTPPDNMRGSVSVQPVGNK